MAAFRSIWLSAALAAGLSAAVPAAAGETGLTCAEKYKAAQATGKLNRDVTRPVFMARCMAETKSRFSGSGGRPQHE
jgi:hypothetical protein